MSIERMVYTGTTYFGEYARKEIITEIKKKNEELSNQINNSLQQFEMNQIKAKELKDKEDNLNKKEANLKDKEDKKIRTPLTHTNRKNAYMHKTGINGNVLFKSRLYLWL